MPGNPLANLDPESIDERKKGNTDVLNEDDIDFYNNNLVLEEDGEDNFIPLDDIKIVDEDKDEENEVKRQSQLSPGGLSYLTNEVTNRTNNLKSHHRSLSADISNKITMKKTMSIENE